MNKKLIVLCIVELAVIMALITVLIVAVKIKKNKSSAAPAATEVSTETAGEEASVSDQTGGAHDEVIKKLREKYDDSIHFVSENKTGDLVMNAGFRKPYVGSFDFLVKNDGSLSDNYIDMLYVKLVETQSQESNQAVSCEWQNEDTMSFERPVRLFYCTDRSLMNAVTEEMADTYEYLIQNDYIASHLNEIPEWHFICFDEPEKTNVFPPAVMKKYDRVEYINKIYDMIDKAFIEGRSDEEVSYDDSGIDKSYYTDEVKKELWKNFSEDTENRSSRLSYGSEYRMIVIDAAMGSRAYVMLYSKDSGKNIDVVNYDPLNGTGGQAYDFKMFDDGTGYISQVWNGGDDGDLFRTENGGGHFSMCDLPSPEAYMPDGTRYDPFTIPQMPEKEGNDLTLIVKQSEYAGDYKGGNIAGQYKSSDNGKTWIYVSETEVKGASE